MALPLKSHTVKQWPGFPAESSPCDVTLHSLDLTLRTAFGTSHSATSNRTNALVVVRVNGFTGLGEAGLPPKKPGCYEADVEDCGLFIENVFQRFKELDAAAVAQYDPFARAPAEYFKAFRRCLLPRSVSPSGDTRHSVIDPRVAEYLDSGAEKDSTTTRAACVTLLQAW